METWNLRLAHLLLVINFYAKYQVNPVETEGGDRRTKTVTGFFSHFKARGQGHRHLKFAYCTSTTPD